ncbi:hypothetical protein SUGI_1000890 [Cryptomeria japonica]|nr:hypothetical protein SUGI_1000890 [Cryptomeria japonica]
MHDQTTQRPRGFVFVNYEMKDVVDKVMTKTLHDLKGKVVEVKRAIPKEQSRASESGLSMAMNRGVNFYSGFGQGCIFSLEGTFSGRMNLMGAQNSGRTGVFFPCSTYSFGCSRIGGGYWPSLVRGYGSRGFGSSPVYGGLLGCTRVFGSSRVGRSMWGNRGIGCGVAGDSTGYEILGGSDMSCLSEVQTWDSMATVANQVIHVSSGYFSGGHGFRATKSFYSSDAGGYMGQGSVYGIKDPELRLNPPESRPLPIDYGLSHTVADGIAGYGGPLIFIGRQPNIGIGMISNIEW